MTEEEAIFINRFLGTTEGQRFLGILEKKFREETDLPDGKYRVYYERGQRNVINTILRAITRGGNVNDTGSNTT